MKRLKIGIIPHTHWDREWYFTSSKSMIYSLHDFDEVIEYLEQDEKFKCFIFDGQTSIIEDYISMRPDMEDRIKKLAKENRIIIGPWYTQPDTLVISGESLIRNLLYGTRKAKELGNCMKVGYLPDSFGMSEQMPQIYRGFGFKYAAFRRGISDELVRNREFYWSSPNGDEVFAHNIYAYGSFGYPPEKPDELKEYIMLIVDKLKEKYRTGLILLFNGEDQKPIRKNLPQIIETAQKVLPNMDFEIMPLEEGISEIERSGMDFERYQGEFTFGQYSRTHKSIFSTRADLKIMNNRIENYLQNIAEPVSSMAHMLGFRYEEKVFEKVWKLMLDNSAHDSIGMCNSDETNRYVEHRFIEANNLSVSLTELKLREISTKIPVKDNFQFQVYNLLPYERGGLLEAQLFLPSTEVEIYDEQGNIYQSQIIDIKNVTDSLLKKSIKEIGVDNDSNTCWHKEIKNIYDAKVLINIERLQPFSYKTLYIREKEKPYEPSSRSNNFIENEYFSISVYDNGIIDIYDKKRKRNCKDAVYFEDDGDEGDSYDYSEPTGNKYLRNVEVKNIYSRLNTLKNTLHVTFKMPLPYNLEERSQGKTSVNNIIDLDLSLIKNNPNIGIDVTILNRAIEHRLRMVVNTDIHAEYSYADEQFGTIKRKVYLKEVEFWKEQAWNEKPRTIEPMQSFVGISNRDFAVQVVTDSVREYQIIGERFNKIAMTIMRSTPYLGKENLNDRPGRESGTKAPTFDAELINKEINARYYISHHDRYEPYEFAKNAKEILTPIISYQGAQFKNNTTYFVITNPDTKDLPLDYSAFEIMGDVILSTVKKREGKDDLVIRFYNPDRAVNREAAFKGAEGEVYESTLDENPILKIDDGKIKVGTCEVKSIIYSPINIGR
ncbi:MAG TPA: alpha-mannosidase [Clostridiaceae bacterium]|jgi:mannosylglycerate hydrolase|nr:alpha-mannosidase [Clostridiaceae bacterium]HBG38578.1 alpha-mannosidase [Clostridiaceae bacterium]HBN28239.1 alpha-mannosidase [Clostridiaceae bacterium]HCL50359.1 alpha-mannosidase [Clostridiaceae bacterium]